MWYLLTHLIEVDGSMTFIDFLFTGLVLVSTPFIQASVRLGCYYS